MAEIFVETLKIVERKLPHVPSYRVVVVAVAAVVEIVVVAVVVVAFRTELGLAREDEVEFEVGTVRPLHDGRFPGTLIGRLVDLQVDQVRDGPHAVVRNVGCAANGGPVAALDRSR